MRWRYVKTHMRVIRRKTYENEIEKGKNENEIEKDSYENEIWKAKMRMRLKTQNDMRIMNLI